MVNTLLDQLTFCVVTFIRENRVAVADRISSILELSARSHWTRSEGSLEIKSVYFPRPQKGGARPISVAIWSPKSNPQSSVFFADSSDGWIRLIEKLSSSGMANSVSLRSTNERERWQLQEISCLETGARMRRQLQILEDEEGLHFHETGAPLPFEDLKISSRDRITSRLLVTEFVKHLGVEMDSPDFWTTEDEATYFFQAFNHNAYRIDAFS